MMCDPRDRAPGSFPRLSCHFCLYQPRDNSCHLVKLECPFGRKRRLNNFEARASRGCSADVGGRRLFLTIYGRGCNYEGAYKRKRIVLIIRRS